MKWILLVVLSIQTFDGNLSVSEFSALNFLSQNLPRSSPTIFTPMVGTKHNACRANGKTGVCMFSWECVTAGGTPMGVCIEEFSYGTCCTTPSLTSPLTKVRVTNTGSLKPVLYGTHQCGMQSTIFIRRGHIYNGQDAQFGELPWMVSLRRVSTRVQTVPWCGGALLNNEWVLTAAHCFHKVTSANIIARLGELDFANPNRLFPFVERRIGLRISHPKYVKDEDGDLMDFDIMLLKFERPIRFQPHISPICLPPFEESITDGTAVVAGWGKIENSGYPSVIQKVTVPILNNEKCSAMMMEEGYDVTFSNKLFCAGYTEGIRDACQGDSGSPLQMKGEDGRYFIIGLVSTGIGCAKPNFPGIYLRVSPFLSWILETMSTN